MTAGVESVGAVTVAHPLVSISLPAFQVPLTMVVMVSSVLQTMTFFLCTEFGIS